MIFLYIIIALSSSVIAFININPQFGSNPTSKQKQYYSTLSNYDTNEFINLEETLMMTEKMTIKDFFKEYPNQKPYLDIKPKNIDIDAFKNESNHLIKFSWLGHSAFLFNIEGKLILLDPMLSEYAAPIPVPSLKRYNSTMPFSIEDISTIDIVIISHDHYDHLDFPTIKKLKNKVKRFIVPHGIGNHLKNWGVNEKYISELNWNENIKIDGIELICLPSRHFSGRGPMNRNSTLWSSWAINSKSGKIYFSGDSGYGSHFKTIGDEFGPFDLVLIDSGQYNSAWKHSHMFPHESVQAAQDLKGEYFMPIHWGGFTLSTHSWVEPIENAIINAKKINQKIIAPQIGQIVVMDNINLDINKWWEKFMQKNISSNQN
jgi:L-ascorbate metabolism protein UlaG (beta-lactamase superfamily)